MANGIRVEESTFFQLSPELEKVALSLRADATHHDQLIALSTVVMREVGYCFEDEDNRFKNSLTTPIRDEILNDAKITNPSLTGLPVEILQKIVALLDEKSVMSLKSCSKKFRDLL